jgi:ribosomal protein L6P/L9E
MSRIGNAPITIPEGVEITQSENTVTVKGKKRRIVSSNGYLR